MCTKRETESGISHLEITPQCASSVNAFAAGKPQHLHFETLFSKNSQIQGEDYELGGCIINLTDEKIPNNSWETDSSTSPPVRTLFCLDTA